MPTRHDLWHWWHQAGHILHTMTFRLPAVLFCLALLPLMLIVYAVRERRRSRAVARFGNPALMPNLVKDRPRWRRHLIPVVMLLALASLLVGAARPQRPVLADKRAPTIVLAMDTSGSMAATDVKPSRLTVARGAANTLVAALPVDGRVGIIAFTRAVHVLNTPTADRSVIRGSLNALKISGGTAIGDAIAQAQKLVQADGSATAAAASGHPAAAIVVLSDGSNTEGKIGPIAAAKAARKAGIPVYTVSLGTAAGTITNSAGVLTKVPPAPQALAAIATAGGGKSYTAHNAAELKSVYKSIGKKVGTEQKQQDLGVGFIGLATILLLGSTGLSLRWFRRAI
jgi:Ca-activated chloride channel family protein